MGKDNFYPQEKKPKRYLSVCVECREGSVEHAAAHLSVAVVQGVRDKKEEEWGDLRLLQVLRQLIQSQSNAASEMMGHRSIRKNVLIKVYLRFY